MFNSVLSSVGLSIGANTSNTTSFLSDTIITGCQDRCCDPVFRGIGWAVD